VPKFGSKTRINGFFHVTTETIAQFCIEKEYLRPLMKSPKDSSRVEIQTDEMALHLFVCRRTTQELKKLGHTGALSYIKWGENQTYTKGEFNGLKWPQGAWVKDRQPGWYSLPNTETNDGQIFTNHAIADRHLNKFCAEPIVCDNTIYFLETLGTLKENIIAASINSSLFAMSSEVLGALAMGDGALIIKVEDARDYLLVPDLRKATKDQLKEVGEAFAKVCKREIGNVFEEVKQKDRQALDAAVLRAIGLDPKKYLQPIYDGLCELVRERIELGQMRGKARKVKNRKGGAEKQILQEVLTEQLPNGPHRFPDEFFSDTAKGEAKTDIELPDKELILDTGSLLPALYAKDKSWNRAVKSPAEGRFLLYAQQAGHKVAQLPAKPVEVSRTVANYEKYLRELRQRLYEEFHRRTLDTRIAATLTQSVFDKFRLPKVET
jgi:hypothetical protein